MKGGNIEGLGVAREGSMPLSMKMDDCVFSVMEIAEKAKKGKKKKL